MAVKKVLARVGLAVALAVVQAVLMRHLGGGRFPVALALPVVVWLGMEAPIAEGALGAVAIGWVLDALSGAPSGLHAFLAVLLFLASRLASTLLDVRGRAAFGLACGAGTFLFGLAALVLRRVSSPPEAAPGWPVAGRVALEAVLTGLAAPAVRALLLALDRLLEPEETGLLG
jgi:cell shape-determining protein MreD